MAEHSEITKRIRRKIEDKIRKNFTEEKVVALAHLLDIETKPQEKQDKEKK